LHFVVEKGCSTNRAGSMSATLWNGMCKAANLKVTQQQEVNSKYLTYHFGMCVCVPEKELSSLAESFVPYERFTEEVDGKKISYAYRDVSELLQLYVHTLQGRFDNVTKRELSLGGDHGRGLSLFLLYCLYNTEIIWNLPPSWHFKLGKLAVQLIW
jgi:hypothetical protein